MVADAVTELVASNSRQQRCEFNCRAIYGLGRRRLDESHQR
ncbi:MAG: hypothetical protein Ct9H300mP11_30080 [Chloroflexota bacterium]|nr:MAG: hypothetical protein Ct9H300mP11_30080 [Chloroflexota bacterium]